MKPAPQAIRAALSLAPPNGRRRSAEGLVHSLELFDADGQAIATLSGERQPGQSERCEWRCLLDALSTEAESCAP
jgi:putative hemin transport protein